MKPRQITFISATFFGVIALLHLLRLLRPFEVTFANYTVPLWINAVAFVLAGWLAFENWKASTAARR